MSENLPAPAPDQPGPPGPPAPVAATRADLYRLAAFLRELDRMMHPASARPIGSYRVASQPMPPLPPTGVPGFGGQPARGSAGWMSTRSEPASAPFVTDLPWVEAPQPTPSGAGDGTPRAAPPSGGPPTGEPPGLPSRTPTVPISATDEPQPAMPPTRPTPQLAPVGPGPARPAPPAPPSQPAAPPEPTLPSDVAPSRQPPGDAALPGARQRGVEPGPLPVEPPPGVMPTPGAPEAPAPESPAAAVRQPPPAARSLPATPHVPPPPDPRAFAAARAPGPPFPPPPRSDHQPAGTGDAVDIQVRGLDVDPAPQPSVQAADASAPADSAPEPAPPDDLPGPPPLPGSPGPRLVRPTLPPVVAGRVQRDLERHYLDRSLRRLR